DREDAPVERQRSPCHYVTLAPRAVRRLPARAPRSWRRDEYRHRRLRLQLLREPAVETPPRPASCSSADHDHVGGLLARDLPELHGRIADGDAPCGGLAESVVAREFLEPVLGRHAVSLHRDALAVAVIKPGDPVDDMGEDEPQSEPLADRD